MEVDGRERKGGGWLGGERQIVASEGVSTANGTVRRGRQTPVGRLRLLEFGISKALTPLQRDALWLPLGLMIVKA